jgi:hypothetical protein
MTARARKIKKAEVSKEKVRDKISTARKRDDFGEFYPTITSGATGPFYAIMPPT